MLFARNNPHFFFSVSSFSFFFHTAHMQPTAGSRHLRGRLYGQLSPSSAFAVYLRTVCGAHGVSRVYVCTFINLYRRSETCASEKIKHNYSVLFSCRLLSEPGLCSIYRVYIGSIHEFIFSLNDNLLPRYSHSWCSSDENHSLVIIREKVKWYLCAWWVVICRLRRSRSLSRHSRKLPCNWTLRPL